MFEKSKIDFQIWRLAKDNIGRSDTIRMTIDLIMEATGDWAADKMKREGLTAEQAALSTISKFVVRGYGNDGLKMLQRSMPDVYVVVKALYAIGYKTVALSNDVALQRSFYTVENGGWPFEEDAAES